MGKFVHNPCMVRPCFLVIDREYSGSISTRKLVIETAKFNVITAYSEAEALATLKLFPAVSGIVMDIEPPNTTCAQMVESLQALDAKLPIIVVGGNDGGDYGEQVYFLPSFEPARLLELLKKLEPKASEQIEKRNEELDSERS